MKSYLSRVDLRIALTYALFGVLWILLSDRFLESLVTDPAVLTDLQSYKGGIFVLWSSLLIFLLLRREVNLRVVTEEKIIESEESHRQLFENSLDAILLTAPDGSIYGANPAACAMFEKNEAEIRQGGRSSLVDVSDPRLRSALEERARTGKFHGELTFIRADGSTFEGELSTTIFKNSKGIDRTSMIIRDVSERKHVERQIQNSEERFSKIFYASPFAMHLFRLSDGSSLHANNAFLALTGYSREDLHERTAAELDLFVDPSARNVWMQELNATGTASPREVQIRKKNGEVRQVSATIEVIHVEQEKLGLVMAVDVTERALAELTLRESEEQYRTLVQISPNSIFINRNNRIEFINQAGIKLLGASGAEEIIGKSPYEIFHPDFHELIKERIRIMLEDKKPVGLVEEQIVRCDGAVRDVEVAATPFEDRGATSIQVIMRDITERKSAREELHLSRDRLAELSRRLVEAHEAESRAIGRELHDQIGQALTALKITLEMIPQLPPERSAKKMETAQGLVDELLNHVRRISLDLRPPMLDDLGLVPTLLWHVNRFQEQTNIEVDFKHSGAEGNRFSPEIETTAYRVIQEALTNTARHTKTVRMELQVRADHQRLQIIIEDQGQGFDPQNALDRQTSIGLRGMRERVNLLGGIFHIESKLNQGTVVEIEIPLSEK